MKVLFVCLGNICRSPLAEGIFNHLLQEQNLQQKVSCDSAGTASYHIGELPDERAIKIAKQNNIKLTHKARQFNKNDFYHFDLIIAMDRNNLRDITKQMPANAKATVKLMREFDYLPENYDVPDPYYGDFKDFEWVYNMLLRCNQNLLDYIKNNLFMKTYHIVVKGRVQQVFFRKYTYEKAIELGLFGWVRNLPDKSVECVICGPIFNCNEFIKWCYKGSPLSKVEEVIVNELNKPIEENFFEIR
jgi:protein-tyrosine phosphatase